MAEYAETIALEAMLNDDVPAARNIIDGMLPGERTAFVAALVKLAASVGLVMIPPAVFIPVGKEEVERLIGVLEFDEDLETPSPLFQSLLSLRTVFKQLEQPFTRLNYEQIKEMLGLDF